MASPATPSRPATTTGPAKANVPDQTANMTSAAMTRERPAKTRK
jgi:hypothetical protein